MSVIHFEFLVEEPSMEALLKSWLPGFLPESSSFTVHPYQGKHALLRKLEARLKGYASWIPDNYRIVVVIDRDSEDCRQLKAQLERHCKNAELRSKSACGDSSWQVVTRIAIEELEAWYFGDWRAVRTAYPRVSEHVPNRAAFRNPDAIAGGTKEAFERELRRSGYFEQGLSTVQAANMIGKHMDPARNRSRSFASFRDVLLEAAASG
ncbi:MAG: DUF4276 family protein [Gammaproteobacteria bacterium]|nr:DUF4276 family protein [Gammaproteobacteria bacterium]MCY4183492.1 DUF4276 family protein [Gammaproteobacteria bacterium]